MPGGFTSRQHTVVSRVSAHGRLNITRDFGPHGRLPGIKIPYVYIEAATAACGTWALTHERVLAWDTAVITKLPSKPEGAVKINAKITYLSCNYALL